MNPLKESIKEAKDELRQAEQHLNYSDKDFVDVAITEYNAKLTKLNALLKRAKKYESN
jgi:hypothetical protein